MAIIYQEENRTFTLHTKNTTYQMMVDKYGFLLHLYYGARTEGCMDYLLTYADRGFSGNPYDAMGDRTYSLDALPQEYPMWGQGDYRSPALMTRDKHGAYGCSLRYAGYQITDGKYALKGLPAVYAGKEEAQTLVLTMKDEELGLTAELLYGVLPDCDVITRAARIINTSDSEFVLEKAFTANLDFVGGKFDAIVFYGRHAMERNMQRTHVEHGAQMICSRRGMSSHQYNPMMILMDQSTTEGAGRCWSMQFVYSGGFKGLIEKDQYTQTRMQLGLMDELFSYPLRPGDVFTLPEVMLSFSNRGLTDLSHNLHNCIRSHVCRGKWRDRVRPVLVNSWEAAYYDFNAETILELASSAKELGVEMVVMDDGWFGKRDDDNSGLGDWVVNEEKMGCTLDELVQRVNDMGMRFGIWVEPEMVNEDSDLYRQHPDWALSIPGRKPVRSRNQLVLDFSRKEVVDCIFDQLSAVFDKTHIEYVKWDYNRGIADVFSYAAEDQGKVLYDYMLGVYDLLERMVTRYPDLLIEGCAGGGGRFDAGMLYYSPQIWCSDNTDAVDRVKIQYGTSFGYPPCTMGAHVSVCPNEQNGRITPFETRAAVAMAGTFGYELDPGKLSEEEKEQMRSQIEQFHRFAPLIHNGDYYRLSNAVSAPFIAWESAAVDGSEALVTVVLRKIQGNMTVNYVPLKGLTRGCLYREDKSGRIYPADALMDVGLPMPVEFGEYHSYLFHFEKVTE